MAFSIKSLSLLTLFLLFHVKSAVAVYDPLNPPHRKNFDPLEANPEGNITCIGRPEFPLPEFEGWDPNGNTLQELCAEPQYGGLIDKHAGAFCKPFSQLQPIIKAYEDVYNIRISDLNPPVSTIGVITFDKHFESRTNAYLTSPRFWRYCRQRCYCNANETSRGVKPNGIDYDDYPNHPLYRRSLRDYRIKVDVVDDWLDIDEPATRNPRLDPPHDHWPPAARDRSLVTFASNYPELTDLLGRNRAVPLTTIFTHPENDVTCDGELPTFHPPAPHSRSDFKNNQELCAMALSGGNRTGNAGAYCHRNNAYLAAAEGYQERSVWFSDEMTPRVEWTWGGNDFLWAVSVRFHCRKHCRCSTKARQRKNVIDPAIKVWRFAADATIFSLSGGGNLEIRTDRKTGSSGQGGGQQGGGGNQQTRTESYSPTCGPDKNQFCPMKWPVHRYGAIPREPPAPSDEQCDLSCSHNNDCVAQSSAECPLYRRCVVNPGSARQTVLGSVSNSLITYTLATCLIGKRPGGLSSIRGRSVDPELEERMAWPCACNSTYISHACCDAENGLVYEKSTNFIGSLDL